jgi:chromate transporter
MNARPGLWALFGVFLKLGCTSFGGPVAHLGYFEEELVRRQRWIDEKTYADLVALCQFLPGPASSQVVFAVGLRAAGLPGGMLAWAGFTLPSALLMLAAVPGIAMVSFGGWLVGLKLAAAAVVADAIWNMASRLCCDRVRALTALMAAAFLICVPGALPQMAVIAVGGAMGWVALRGGPSATGRKRHVSVPGGWMFLVVFAVLLFGLPVLAAGMGGWWLEVIDGFYRAGALVFGGGHVILPLLDQVVVSSGWVDRETFLAGYGAAQALPGPLFAVAAFYGSTAFGLLGGVVAILAISLPSWLLVLGVLPWWDRLREMGAVRSVLAGANAAVVGLLLAAFYNPIGVTSLTSGIHITFALVAFALLRYLRVPPWALVAACAIAGALVFHNL